MKAFVLNVSNRLTLFIFYIKQIDTLYFTDNISLTFRIDIDPFSTQSSGFHTVSVATEVSHLINYTHIQTEYVNATPIHTVVPNITTVLADLTMHHFDFFVQRKCLKRILKNELRYYCKVEIICYYVSLCLTPSFSLKILK